MLTQPLPRRRFLKLFATSSAWAVSSGIVLQLSGCESALPPLKKTVTEQFGALMVFNESQASILYSLSEAYISNAKSSLQLTGVIQRLDEELYFVSDGIREDFKLALDVLEHLPLAYGKFSRLSHMAIEQRRAFLSAIQDSSIDTIRAVANACRMTVFMTYYNQESTWSTIGYQGTFSRMPEKLGSQRQHYAKEIS